VIQNNKIYPCLWFDSKAEEASAYYKEILPHSQLLLKTPMVTIFELLNKKIMGLNGGPMFQLNQSISFFVTNNTVEETKNLWNKLIQGGSAMMDISSYPWSECYGWLKDKYGMTWQISVKGKKEEDPSLRPALLFANEKFGRAEEAILTYSKIFTDYKLNLMEKYPEDSPYANKVMYSEISLYGMDFIFMDGPGVHDFDFNEALSFVIDCETQDEIDYYWDHLTKGGKESMCGWLKDSFGISWQIVPTIIGSLMTDPERAPRIMNEVMKMKKLDIKRMLEA